jgi:hypothetical protein
LRPNGARCVAHSERDPIAVMFRWQSNKS